MRSIPWFLALLAVTAAVPWFAPPTRASDSTVASFPGWPLLEAGTVLPEVPLTDAERGFSEAFPGKLAKFGDARHTYVVRWITSATRRLHPAEDCFRASGYAIHHESRCPAQLEGGVGCFTAEKDGAVLDVYERITDSEGKVFTDVSAWYWAAMRGTSQGPWWSVTKVVPR